MSAWLRRLAMSFIVTLGFTTGKLPAQAPLLPPAQPFDATPVPPLGSVLARPEVQETGAHPRANKAGYCCAGNSQWFGCGNWKTQFDFMFGSCRSFFGEPCVPVPPAEPREPRAGLLSRLHRP